MSGHSRWTFEACLQCCTDDPTRLGIIVSGVMLIQVTDFSFFFPKWKCPIHFKFRQSRLQGTKRRRDKQNMFKFKMATGGVFALKLTYALCALSSMYLPTRPLLCTYLQGHFYVPTYKAISMYLPTRPLLCTLYLTLHMSAMLLTEADVTLNK